VIPLRDENPTLDTSAVTLGLIAANVGTWLFLQGFGTDPRLSVSVCELGAIPGELLGTLEPGTSVDMGSGLACVLGEQANWYSPLTSMFMHGGWFHLLGNLWFLYIFGDNVEDVMGRARFLVFYLLCGLLAVAAQIFSDPDSVRPIVGASGAIGGVMGAYAVLYPRTRVHMLIFLGFFFTFIEVPALLMLVYWLIWQLLGALPAVQGAGGGVAFWAHVGGFVAGMVLVGVFRDAERLARHRARTA